MNMVPCPNNGRCGSRNHRVGSAAYDRCVQDSTGDAYKSPFVRLTNTPRNASNDSDIELGSMTRTFKRFGAYVQPDSPIFSEVSLNSRQIQDYIDNPQSVSFNDKQESLINEGIRCYIGDIADDAGIDIDELSPEDVDIVCQAARKAMDRVDALDCVAEKMGPRTFSYDCAGDSPRASKIFDRRYSTYYDGSKEWYSDMADAYLNDIIDEGWNYDGDDEAVMEADHQAIASALKEALDDNPYIDHLPGINVVWSGSLRDVAPRGRNTRGITIQHPNIVIVDPMGVGPVSKPVQLSGEYRVFIPDEEKANEGWTSGIRDETPHKLGEFFEQMDHSGPNRPKVRMSKYA